MYGPQPLLTQGLADLILFAPQKYPITFSVLSAYFFIRFESLFGGFESDFLSPDCDGRTTILPGMFRLRKSLTAAWAQSEWFR